MVELIITSIVSPTLLFIFQMIREQKKGLSKKIDLCLIKQTRLEIIAQVEHNPKDVRTILSLYDEYKKEGGNSYMDAYIENWKKKYLNKGGLDA